MTKGRCPIWNTPAEVIRCANGMIEISSTRAGGRYAVARETIEDDIRDPEIGERISRTQAALISSWIWEQNFAGEHWPLLTDGIVKWAKTRARLPINERLLRLMRQFRRDCPQLNAWIDGKSDKFLAAAECQCEQELCALWRFAGEQGLVEYQDIGSDDATDDVQNVRLTGHGHVWLDEMDKANRQSAQGFVAMWFDRSMDRIYAEGFARAVEEAGYRPVRVDQGEFAGKIDDEVIAQIRRSRFMVADLTAGLHEGQIIPRGSVYYEAGFAEGLGIPVLYTRRKDMKEAVHFDLRQHNFIVWTDADDLRQRLKRRISAVLGDGPHRQGD